MDYKTQNPINQRFIEVAKSKRKSQVFFAEQFEMSKQSLSRYYNDDAPISIKAVIKLKELYPDLNLNWLIKGEGEMYIQKERVLSKEEDELLKRNNDNIIGRLERIEAILKAAGMVK